ncbi:MAG: septum formation initiator family protein [Candidatus Kerfeldbacteria bacterium]|nr:septum formation initiator family protein [Candidatus Kerfeldbacteria bacterium]
MPRLRSRQRSRSFLRSRAITVGLLVVTGAISLAVGREIARQVSIQQELQRLKAEIARSEQSTQNIERLITTLKSQTYQEGEARTRLNLQKPGENVLIIPNLSVNENSNRQASGEQAPESTSPKTNPNRWWNFLFAQPQS